MTDRRAADLMIVSGFLGSGKTTLIRRLLSNPPEGLGRIALLVNEVGRIGVDGALLAGRDIDLVELTSGCICCTMKTDFVRAVLEIRERVDPDLIIVEATGVAQPGDILENLLHPPLQGECGVRGLVTVVGADIFEARRMFGPFYDHQIRFADVLLLNKVDLVSPESASVIRERLGELNPHAAVFTTEHCALDPARLFSETSAGTTHHEAGHLHPRFDEWGFQAFSFEHAGVLDRKLFEEFLDALPPTLFRLKGWVRFAEGSALLDFSAGRYRIAPIDEARSTALAFVGRNCDEGRILDALRKCLLRDAPGRPGSGEPSARVPGA